MACGWRLPLEVPVCLAADMNEAYDKTKFGPEALRDAQGAGGETSPCSRPLTIFVKEEGPYEELRAVVWKERGAERLAGVSGCGDDPGGNGS